MEVIITRPAHQANSLLTALQAQGIAARSIPLLTIEPLTFKLPETPTDSWIFISPNAVDYLASHLSTSLRKLIGDKAIFAIGESTARCLHKHQVSKVVYPQTANSESLLAMPQLQSVKNQRIMLVCGVGGRDTIESTLIARGARVERLEVYQRMPVDNIQNELPRRPLWIVSSAAVLEVLDRTLGDPQQVLVTSERLAHLALQKQHQVCAISNSALDQDIINCLSQMTAG